MDDLGVKNPTIFGNFHPYMNSIPYNDITSYHLRGVPKPPQLLRSVRLEGIDAWDSASLLLRRVHRCLEPKDLPESLSQAAQKGWLVVGGSWIFLFTTMMGIGEM